MLFTDLPEEIVHLILSQNCVSDQEVVHFAKCLSTSSAAYRRLISDRVVAVKCQEEEVLLNSHYDFGVYGSIGDSNRNILQCTLATCVGPKATLNKQNILRHAAHITINMCLDDENTLEVVHDLIALVELLRLKKKTVILQLTVKYWNPALTALVMQMLTCLVSLQASDVHMKLHVPLWYLPIFASGLSGLRFKTINIQAEGVQTLDDVVSFHINNHLQKLKLICSFQVPNLQFEVSPDTALEVLELDLPLSPKSSWIIENHLLRLTGLQDLRVFTIEETHLLRSIFGDITLGKLHTLYICFREAIEDSNDFDFRRLAPMLQYLHLSDRRWVKTTKMGKN